MRTITIYSTLGGIKKINTDVTKWGELKNLLEGQYDFTNLDATESINKTTLSHNDAILPNEDFVVFLRPSKAAGGAFDYNTNYRTVVSALTAEDKEKIKERYGKAYNMIPKVAIVDYLNNKNQSVTNDDEDVVVEKDADCQGLLHQLAINIKTIIQNVFNNYGFDEDSEIEDELFDRINSLIFDDQTMEETMKLEKALRELTQGF